MRVVQITSEESLVREFDKFVAKLGTTRSAYTRELWRQAMRKAKTADDERRWLEGYERQPLTADEREFIAAHEVMPPMSAEEERAWNEVKSAGTRSRRRTRPARS